MYLYCVDIKYRKHGCVFENLLNFKLQDLVAMIAEKEFQSRSIEAVA